MKDLNQKALAVLLGEAVKPNDPANLRGIITNHTKLLSKAEDRKAKEFHRTAIANAKEKLKSLGEETEEENLSEKYVKPRVYTDIHNALVLCEKFLTPSSALAKDIIKEFGKGYADDFKKMEKLVESLIDEWEEIDREVSMGMNEDVEKELDEAYVTKIQSVKKAMNIISMFDADEMEDLLFSLKEFALDNTTDQPDNKDFEKMFKGFSTLAKQWKNRSGN